MLYWCPHCLQPSHLLPILSAPSPATQPQLHPSRSPVPGKTHPLLFAPVLVLPRVLLLLLLLAATLTLLTGLTCCLTLPPLLVVAVLLEAALSKLGCLGGAVVNQVERVLLGGGGGGVVVVVVSCWKEVIFDMWQSSAEVVGEGEAVRVCRGSTGW